MTSAIQILTLQFADSSSKMLKILADIGDEEFFWEPCAGVLDSASPIGEPRPET
jgi:hypothetical protein